MLGELHLTGLRIEKPPERKGNEQIGQGRGASAIHRAVDSVAKYMAIAPARGNRRRSESQGKALVISQ
jgi:hypothetical protein